MSEDTPSSSASPANPASTTGPAASPPATQEGMDFNIGEEFGTARRNLPPARIVLIGVAIIIVVAAMVSFVQRAQPQGVGAIDNFAVAEIPNQNAVLVALNVTVRNTGKKPLWIHTIQGTLKPESGEELTDVPVSPIDYDRYFQFAPALKEHAQPALLPETKILEGKEVHGMVLVSFNVTKEGFAKRKSLGVVIQPYDQPRPIVLTK